MPGTTMEQTSKQAKVAPTGNGSGARRLRAGEIVPLTPEQSERLGALYAEYGPRLVRYAFSQLSRWGRGGAGAWGLAEDITQEMWAHLVREGARCPLLGDEPLTADSPAALLFYGVRQRVAWYIASPVAGDIPMDFTDPVTCNQLCPLMPSGCALVELPAYLATMVDALPEQERAALLLMLDGLDPRTIAEHLGGADSTAVRLASAAVLLLQIDNPELSREPEALESLPEWEQHALSELGPERRVALLRLESPARQALLLRHQGLSKREIHQRLGLAYDAVATVARCVPAAGALGRKKKSTGRRANSKFAQVADALREDIRAMRPGDRLPRRVDLMERFGVGSRTVDNAWAVLRGEGLIEPNGVRGYTVARTQDDMEQAA
uniref:GntR family transcriptional regulator n=1 Tax=Streptomyces olivoreticuli TaxID=68246 RepID=UPI002658CE20|nr:GntR family transcriptional regulator [Streptomyces olivoreticuli]WKK26534.1 GntR family transcriptional regulator [Streptomyces olivoreticuli]